MFSLPFGVRGVYIIRGELRLREVRVRSRIIIGVGAVAILIFIAILITPAFIDVNKYRPQIEGKLSDRLGRHVALGPMKLTLIPLAFRVNDAVIGEDPQLNSGRPFATAGSLVVRPRLIPLLRREFEIKSLQLDHPAVELVRNEKGVWNFSTLFKDNGGTGTSKVVLDQIKIYDGTVGITDRQEKAPRAVYDHIDFIVSNFGPTNSFPVELRAHLPGTGQEGVVFKGKVGPVDRDAIARTFFDGRLQLDQVSVSGLQRFIKAEALSNSDAILTGYADLKNTGGVVDSTGNFEVRNPRIHGVNLGYPIGMDYQVRANLNDSTAAIHKANLKLGQTPVSFHGTINSKQAPMQVDMTVQASNASVADAARLAAALGAAFNPGSSFSGDMNLDLHAQGAVTKPVLNGQFAVRNLRISGGEIREPVQVDTVQLSLAPDAIRSNQFTAQTGTTSAVAQFTLSEYASDNPRLDAKVETSNARIEELLRIAHAYGISAAKGVDGAGLATVNVTATGPVKEAGQWVYTGNGSIRNATLDISSIAKPIALRNADIQFNGNGASLNSLDVSVGQTTARGNLSVSNFTSPQVQFALSADNINVAEWEKLFQSAARPQSSQPPQAAQSKPPAGTPATAAAEPSFFSKTTGTGSLTADKIVYDQLTLTNVRGTVALDHGIVTVKPLTATLYNGEQTGSAVVNTRTTPPTYTVDSKLQNVDANQLLSAVSPAKQTLYGMLSANADTHFTTAAGASSIVPSLNGKVSINLKDGKVANVDVLHELATIAQFQGAARAVEPFTKLVQLTGDFDIRNGVARTNNLKAAIDQGSIAAAGAVDLARQALDLHVTAVLPQEYSQAVGGTGIGGFLTTALANTKGELVIPVLVTGTFQAPQFAPDLQKVAEMKLQNLVPGLANPGQLQEGILGQILRGKPQPQPGQQQTPEQQQNPNPAQPAQPAQPPGGFNDLLDLLRKGQKQPGR
jgi:uncharacterized protein involved in outer membrane biogenesis